MSLDRCVSASYFAAQKHKNQKRKDNEQTPYINHPLHVAKLLTNSGVTDVNVIMAGLLHDTIEDTKTTYEELCKEFGQKVADIVKECSDDKSLSKIDRKKLQIIHAKHASKEAKAVKLADKLSNLSDLSTNPPAKWSENEILGYYVWAYAVYRVLLGTNLVLEEELMNLFNKVFSKYKIDIRDEAVLEKELEKYYKCIDKSE